ncbi:unnamed protein product, partial [Rotaria sp. Silwood2]
MHNPEPRHHPYPTSYTQHTTP